MSSTIQIQTGMKIVNGPLFNLPNKTVSVNMAGTHVFANVQDIPTTAGGTQLAIEPGVATAGWGFFQNLDDTNYVDVGVQVAGAFETLLRLMPGDPPALVRLSTLTIFALAHTATVSMQFGVLEA